MLKTAALALVVLVAGTIGANGAMAGVDVHTPPRLLGRFHHKGDKMKKFRPSKLGKIIIFGDGGRARALTPRRLPGL